MTRFHFEKLKREHALGSFDCGVDALNHFLQRYALQNQAAQTSQTYVCLADGETIAGYFALAVGQIEHETAPDRLRKGVARYPIPVTVIARLAVDKRWQGRGLGLSLLKEALLRALTIADIAGMRAVVVHAKDDAAKAFYQRFGFQDGFLNPLHLYLLTKDLKTSLG